MECEIPGREPASPLGNSFQITIEASDAGMRLDQFLALTNPSLSRSVFSSSIRNGSILVDAMCRKASYRLKEGEIVSGAIEQQEMPGIIPQPVDFSIIFEDEFFLIISKPPGIVVHPGSGNSEGTLVNGLVHYCESIAAIGDGLRPGIVHRLDKDTSGIMLVAKQDSVHRKLVDDFKNRRITKEYLAILHGTLKEKSGRMVAPIGRHPVHRQKMAINESSGRYAVSNWQVLEEFSSKFSLVKLVIETGRTHQIRVHMASLGCPVAGDGVYGGNRNNSAFPRQLLHASRLVFYHPVNGQLLDHRAELWPDFTFCLEELRGNQTIGATMK
ncbi:MAG: RluA family pseudouridine synthase [Desulforhopalus sp.]|nr:RluA family pseudouridine synthase [Desulforhopalus sp.]